MEILRLHYAMTLRHWRNRFRAAWHTAAERYGERFCRMWEFYLAGSEIGFRYENLMVFQLQLTRDLRALPLTRDYIGEAERDLALRDVVRAAGPPRQALADRLPCWRTQFSPRSPQPHALAVDIVLTSLDACPMR